MVSAMAANAPAPIRAKSLVSIASVPEHLGGGGDIATSRCEETPQLFALTLTVILLSFCFEKMIGNFVRRKGQVPYS